MSGNRPIATSGQRKGKIDTAGRLPSPKNRRARCEYCRGWVAEGEDRSFLVGGEMKYVHRRHPVRESEQEEQS